MNFEIPEGIKTWSQFGHPLLMWVVFGLSIYALYLGIKSKKTRTTEDKEKRKELIKGQFSARHHQVGAILLALMVLGNFGGMAVTYINNGKLFVGPHLLVGIGMTILIVLSASLVPLMQKDNWIARKTHVVLNIVLVHFFAWQIFSGMEIVQKLISKL